MDHRASGCPSPSAAPQVWTWPLRGAREAVASPPPRGPGELWAPLPATPEGRFRRVPSRVPAGPGPVLSVTPWTPRPHPAPLGTPGSAALRGDRTLSSVWPALVQVEVRRQEGGQREDSTGTSAQTAPGPRGCGFHVHLCPPPVPCCPRSRRSLGCVPNKVWTRPALNRGCCSETHGHWGRTSAHLSWARADRWTSGLAGALAGDRARACV